MTTIFLNLGPRRSGGELLPDAPFRAFVKFNTAHDKNGGCAILVIEENGQQIGTITVDWPAAEARRHPRGGKYWVADGSLDDYDLPESLPDWRKANLAFAAMEKAKWPFFGYDHGLDSSTAKVRFETWTEKNL